MNLLCIVTYVPVFGDISCMGGGMTLLGDLLLSFGVEMGLVISGISNVGVLLGSVGILAEYDRVKLLGSPKVSICVSSVSFWWGWRPPTPPKRN